MSDVVRRNPGTASQGEMFESGGLMPKPNPVAEAAARRVVLRRYALGMTAADTRELLAMLGLLPETGPQIAATPSGTEGHAPMGVGPPAAKPGGTTAASDPTSTEPKEAA